MKCQYCEGKCIKAGKQKSGAQKFQCKNCKKYQQELYQYQACDYQKKKMIAKLIINHVGIRGIRRLLKISYSTIIKEILEKGLNQGEPETVENGIYQVDEMKSFCGNKKNEMWVVYGTETRTGNVIGINVGKRNKSLLRKTINSILMTGPKKIYTDRLDIYKRIIPGEYHRISKFMLSKVERMHLTVRNRIMRFGRKTLGFTKNPLMALACLKLLLWKTS